MDPEGHARQLQGIADRHGDLTVADILEPPERPHNDYHALRESLMVLRVVRQVDLVRSEDRKEPFVEIVLNSQTVPPAVMDRLHTFHFSLDPDRTQSRAEHTVVVAV